MNHSLILTVIKYPGERAEVVPVYPESIVATVGGPTLHTPYEGTPGAVYVQNRERGMAGTVVVCTYRDGAYHALPAALLEQAMSRLNEATW